MSEHQLRTVALHEDSQNATNNKFLRYWPWRRGGECRLLMR